MASTRDILSIAPRRVTLFDDRSLASSVTASSLSRLLTPHTTPVSNHACSAPIRGPREVDACEGSAKSATQSSSRFDPTSSVSDFRKGAHVS